MSLDPPVTPSPSMAQSSSSTSSAAGSETVVGLGLEQGYELARYKELRTRFFEHTPVFDEELLQSTGMDTELDLVFRALGWENFWRVEERGSKRLTTEFLCTLRKNSEGISFRFLGVNHVFTWRNLSDALGFAPTCRINIDDALGDFDRGRFLREITRKREYSKARTSDLEIPVLRFLHKWIGFTLFPREDIRIMRVADAKIIYAAVKRIKISPVQWWIDHWIHIPKRGNITCTSLITRIARHLNVLRGVPVGFLTTPKNTLDFDYFNHAHMLKKEGDEIFMVYDNERPIRLPNPDLGLYVVQSFLIDFQAAPVHIPRRHVPPRQATNPNPTWVGADPEPAAPAFTDYQDHGYSNLPRVIHARWHPDFEAGPSHYPSDEGPSYYPTHEGPSYYHAGEGSSQPYQDEGPSYPVGGAHIGQEDYTYQGSGRFHFRTNPGDEQNAPFVPPRASFAGYSYEDRTILNTIQENNTSFYDDQRAHNQQVNQTLEGIQLTQDEILENLYASMGYLGM